MKKDIYCYNSKLFRYSFILSPILFSLEIHVDLDILKGKLDFLVIIEYAEYTMYII